MGRRTSVYLTRNDLARIRALGFPPLGEVIRAGLAVLENWPAHRSDDSQQDNGGPAQTGSDSQSPDGGPVRQAAGRPQR